MSDKGFYCKECCRDISEEDLCNYNGYCKNCYKEIEQQKVEQRDSNYNNGLKKINIVANLIKIISLLAGIIGIIYGLSMLDSWRTEELVFPIIIASIVVAIFIYGFGEIIQLLEDIKNN